MMGNDMESRGIDPEDLAWINSLNLDADQISRLERIVMKLALGIAKPEPKPSKKFVDAVQGFSTPIIEAELNPNKPICHDCAIALSGDPVEWPVGQWAGKCPFCGEQRRLTALRDYVWEKYPQESDLYKRWRRKE